MSLFCEPPQAALQPLGAALCTVPARSPLALYLPSASHPAALMQVQESWAGMVHAFNPIIPVLQRSEERTSELCLMKHTNNTTVDSNNKESEILTLSAMISSRFVLITSEYFTF